MTVDFDGLVNAAVVAAFGEPVTWARVGYMPQTIEAIFDRHGSRVEFEGAAPGSVSMVRAFVRYADFAGGVKPLQGDTVTARGATWIISDVTPDGVGGTRLTLSGRGDDGADLP